jgi:nucleotide-binding universal stress UspA family protein
MTYATLMVSLQLGKANAALLQVAGDLAERFQAGVIGVAACRPLGVVCREFPVPAPLFAADRKEIDRAIKAAEVEFRTALQRRTSRLEWRPRATVLPLADQLADEARAADLVVAGIDRKAPSFDPTRQVDTSDLVMQAGRPVLIVPASIAKASFDRVLVGWKDTAESRRAIVDALPFLARAAQVTVAEIVAKEELAEARTRLADVVGWLKHHGIEAQPVAVTARGAHAQALAVIADDRKADLVVAGAYGHSRLGEWVLGGVTIDLLSRADRCSLLSR